MEALEDLKNQQNRQREDQEVQRVTRISSFDYFADDEDLSRQRSPINAFLSKPYILEAASLGFLAVFFAVLNSVGK
jgi:hypothetical protein